MEPNARATLNPAPGQVVRFPDSDQEREAIILESFVACASSAHAIDARLEGFFNRSKPL